MPRMVAWASRANDITNASTTLPQAAPTAAQPRSSYLLFEPEQRHLSVVWRWHGRRTGDKGAVLPRDVGIILPVFVLQQAELAGACHGLRAPRDLKLAEDLAVVPFHRIQGDEQPGADLMVREPFGHELQDL